MCSTVVAVCREGQARLCPYFSAQNHLITQDNHILLERNRLVFMIAMLLLVFASGVRDAVKVVMLASQCDTAAICRRHFIKV